MPPASADAKRLKGEPSRWIESMVVELSKNVTKSLPSPQGRGQGEGESDTRLAAVESHAAAIQFLFTGIISHLHGHTIESFTRQILLLRNIP